MIDRHSLLTDLQKILRALEADLRQRCDEVPAVNQALRKEYDAAREAQRTGGSFEGWRADYITQTAAAWVLTCVFARFLEDNCLVDPPRLSGPGDRLRRARDEHELYFRQRPTETDREYLLAVFDGLAKLPSGAGIFAGHNPIRQQPGWLSGDGARALLDFFQRIEPASGKLVHDFSDPEWDTRFLGDLYQDISEDARKKYALLQTPEFVEEFILDRTLDPAIDEFGLKDFRMIDPACGSGHFLLGSFRRLFERWRKAEPGTNARELARRALDSIHGVDINPYAVAIARFRLLLAAIRTCGITRLADTPAFPINLACGDSLLHGSGSPLSLGWHDLDHVYYAEDRAELIRILKPGRYHAVVANPPYITPKDKALNAAYRVPYSACHGKYSLSVPFMQRLFSLALDGYSHPEERGGYVGQITANSFMKREFGKKLIEEYFAGRGDGIPGVDLTHVIDTSGAYIPGHGTPTVILFGRNRAAVAKTIRAVMGIRGEPSTPDDPAKGLVWSAIAAQVDQPGSQSEFVSVADSPRSNFSKHPWSIGGGGAAELKELLDESADRRLEQLADSIGITSFTLEDEVYILPRHTAKRRRMSSNDFREMVVGDAVRDWIQTPCELAVFPYDRDFAPIPEIASHAIFRHLWQARTCLANNKMFGGKSKVESGLLWYEYGRLTYEKLRTPFSIVFAEIASHNHFVLDRGGKVFKQTAPVIKLPGGASEDEHLGLLGLLNSSTACFWMKQVAHQKQMTGGDGVRIEAKCKVPYAFSGTQLGRLPIPSSFLNRSELRQRLVDLAREADALAAEHSRLTPRSGLDAAIAAQRAVVPLWSEHQARRRIIRSRLIFLQEEIDFVVYAMFGLAGTDLLSDRLDWPSILLEAGQRPFEILCGESPEGFRVPTGIPPEWPPELRDLWRRRMEAIQTSGDLRLIEDPHYKRRWIGRQGLFNWTRNTDELAAACESWLSDRLESFSDFDGRMNDRGEPTAKLDMALVSVARLADVAANDPDFMQVAELYRGRPDFDIGRLVAELVEDESVPLLPVLRYKPSGLEKRGVWERTWELQRQEDAIDARTKLPESDPNYLTEDQAREEKRRQVGDIPVPPKYTSADFLAGPFWRLRGKLDVPKERWVSFPHCEGEDGSLVVAWAGLDHLQLARATSAYFVEIQEKQGGAADPRLVPLLGSILELVPWLKQWHNEVDAEYGMRMGDYFESFVEQEARTLGLTVDEVRKWQPLKRNGRGSRKGAKTQRKVRGKKGEG